ncbi:conserved protein of unknown function [Tenacibaculum sp. 190130A14a]|uniref:Uncharacterized protein n=1 Tax=Tenacibaculum polynesiense TaxID=3137857 RepID=A0ABM9P7H2_9FLAO
MEEIVFKALIFNTKHIEVDTFIKEVLEANSQEDITKEDIKEAIIKLVLYKFIKVKKVPPKGNYIYKENNFFKARELGSVHQWLDQQRFMQAC